MTDYSPRVDEDLHTEPYMCNVTLTDGGVYDNLGLETAWKQFKTILVSDGGGRLSDDATVRSDWVRHGKRAIDIIGNQVTSLRKRQVIDSFKARLRSGTYWGTHTNIADYGLGTALDCPHDKTRQLAGIATRLERMERTTQSRLINWGYAVCDAAMRTHVDNSLPQPHGFPEPNGVG
jgi:NTE family protein